MNILLIYEIIRRRANYGIGVMCAGGNMANALIKEILPHKEPMLLIEKLIIHNDNNVTGFYFFKGDEWLFKGHYPENPIVPGVILCEIMA